MREISYTASTTAAKLHNSDKVVRAIMGPVGSGKSVACIVEMLRLAAEQHPNEDGVRKTRWALIRNTYWELMTTTLKTFRQWIPETICPVTMSPIIIGRLEQPCADGTSIEAEFIFLALDRDEDAGKIGSLELTGAFINESREISFKIMSTVRERIGRYPAHIDGYKNFTDPCKRKALLLDTNPPSDDHWWYYLAELGYLKGTEPEDRPAAIQATREIFDFFRCPSPLIKQPDGTYEPNPEAENIKYLPGGYKYYLDMIAGKPKDEINVQVMGNYGVYTTGRPVYPEYNDQIHCKEIKPIPGLPIALGWDFGLTPTVVIGQLTSTGQLRILDEIVGEGIGVRQFARDIVKPFLSRKYKGYELAFSVGDPAGNNRGEGEGRSAIGILNDNNEDGEIVAPISLGFTTDPAPTNDITQRTDAVKLFLTKMVDAGKPGYIVNPACSMVRKGKQGRYQYKKVQAAGSAERYHDKPDKNDYSHPADAEQYLALGFIHGYQAQSTEHDYGQYDPDTATRSAVGGY